MLIERDGDEFTSRLIEPEYEIQMAILEGVVQENLISAILEAGGGYQVAMDLEEVFGWQINFLKISERETGLRYWLKIFFRKRVLRF